MMESNEVTICSQQFNKIFQMQSRGTLGEYKTLCEMRKGQPFLVLGPDKFKFLFAIILVNSVSAVMLALMNQKYTEAYVFFTVHLVILIYLDLVWIATALLNPGIFSRATHQQYGCLHCKENVQQYHHQIVIRQHCKRCKICIEDRQHHCAIIGGCVGTRNNFAYHFFLLGVVLYFIDFLCTCPYIYYLR